MTSVVRLVFILLILSSVNLSVHSQTQTRANAQIEPATVSGKVTLKGKPAPGVVVFLRGTESMGNPYENSPRATTDQSGLFKMVDVVPGSYQVNILAPAYVVADSGDSRIRMLVVGSGENVENINFTIVRGGVITGKVTDSEGRPIVDERVYAYRAELFNQPQRRGPVTQSAGVMTDDRGIYRMFGVSAGQYKVAAGRGEDVFQGSMTIGRASYQQAFHPSGTDQTKATVVEVTEGSETTGVDIAVGPQMQTYSAAGKAVDEKFLPVPNIRFGIQRLRGERMEFMSTLVNTNINGDFLAEGLLPGKYRVFLFQESGTSMRVDASEFEIVDQDLTGITVKMSKGAGLSGVIIVESEDRRLQAKLPELNVTAYVQPPQGTPSGMGQSGNSPVGADGSFTLGGLPAGSAGVNVYSRVGPNQRWAITRIERDGVLIQNRAIEVKEGEQVAGIRIFVTYGTATLRGILNNTIGEPIKSGVSIRINKQGETTPSMRPVQIDGRGRFVAEGLPAGTYELQIMYGMGIPGMKPRNQRQQVTLTENTATEITITIDTTPDPKP